MLRTPRTRLSAIKYLVNKIPRDLEAVKKQGGIKLSKFTVKINKGQVILAADLVREKNETMMRDRMDQDDYFYFYYPLKEKLVINSLLAGLSDSSVYVNRGVLDFLITHMAITGNINSLTENVRLVEGALMTLIKRDFAFLKKFFSWSVGHLEDKEDNVPLS